MRDGKARSWSGLSRMIAAWAVAGALVLVAFGPAGASADGAGQLRQECIAAALKKPQIGKVGIKHAGSYGGGRTQFAYLEARYGAMPYACHDDNIFKEINDDYYRENQGKAQIFKNGRWTDIISWSEVYGGVWEPDPDPESTWSNVNNQVAFDGDYYSEPPLAHTPTRFDRCRVRILLKESAIRPWPLGYKGRKPPQTFAATVYTIPVPVGRIAPHSGRGCSLLVP